MYPTVRLPWDRMAGFLGGGGDGAGVAVTVDVTTSGWWEGCADTDEAGVADVVVAGGCGFGVEIGAGSVADSSALSAAFHPAFTTAKTSESTPAVTPVLVHHLSEVDRFR